jgi:thioredoxin-related protein
MAAQGKGGGNHRQRGNRVDGAELTSGLRKEQNGAYWMTKDYMKKIAFYLLMCWTAGSLAAADAQWLTSVPEAQALAKKENKLVLMDFTGSDWCSWCKKLDAEVFTKPEFIEYARKNLVLVQVDFPNSKPQSPELQKANKALQSKYKVDGYPTLVVITPDGTIVWQQVGYLEGGPPAVIAALNKAQKT